MLKLVVALMVCVSAVYADDKDDVANAAKKVAELKSFSFSVESKTEGSGFGGGGGGGGGGGPQSFKYEGKFQKDVGQMITTDTMEFVKIGTITAQRPRGDWRVVEDNPQGGGGGGGGQRGRGMGGFFGQRGAPSGPGEDLADFGTKLDKCKKTDKSEKVGDADCSIYEGALTVDAAKAFMPMSRMLDRMGGGDVSGTAKIWIDGDGRLVKYELTTKLEADVQGNAVSMSQTRTVTLSGVNDTKVEIPEAAKAAIEKRKKQGD
jgi:hypothetical protein